MSHQECALHAELVLWLRDRAAELLAGEGGDAQPEQERLDALIREWFFAPQDELHGCAPREIIWAERDDRPNPIYPEHLDGMFPDDCEICAMERRELAASLAAGEDPGFHWYHDDGGYPLIARYDPQEYERQGEEELARFHAWQAEQEAAGDAAARNRTFDEREMTPDEFAHMLLRPPLSPDTAHAVETLVARCDVPEADRRGGLRYRRVTRAEAISLLGGLDRHGTKVDALMKEIEDWPYENVALDWMSEPEQNAALMCQALEQSLGERDRQGAERLRHHRDFCFALAGVIPPGARVWMQGWLEATAHNDESNPF